MVRWIDGYRERERNHPKSPRSYRIVTNTVVERALVEQLWEAYIFLATTKAPAAGGPDAEDAAEA